jgi:hypothetical protein
MKDKITSGILAFTFCLVILILTIFFVVSMSLGTGIVFSYVFFSGYNFFSYNESGCYDGNISNYETCVGYGLLSLIIVGLGFFILLFVLKISWDIIKELCLNKHNNYEPLIDL